MEQSRLELLQQQEADILAKLEKTEEDLQYVEKAIGQFLAQNPYVETQLPGDLVKVLNYKKTAKKNFLTQLESLRKEMAELQKTE